MQIKVQNQIRENVQLAAGVDRANQELKRQIEPTHLNPCGALKPDTLDGGLLWPNIIGKAIT